ncbi:Replication initiator protein A [Xenococcus sp. PCC 7305]|uniref:replication initiator protein A n=1 Tax=Xenococcus sp. PCC 7305 TaxID=102125 RepID=UPI0002ACBAD3|nr:replication initiator protein A [Xenococcus sp. PCC 7305]ELS02720.1 Replication initiator protein A [Xenococcus sp. PCC 7305]
MKQAQQIDLFLGNIADASFKDDRVLMEFPFFSIQKQPKMTPILFEDTRVQIKVEPGPKGIATVWDKDILIYLATLLNDRIEKDLPVSRTIQFAAYDCLKSTGRGTGKRSYELFLDALFRLRSTNIVTTIAAGQQRERRGFGWIETWRVIEKEKADGTRIMGAVEVTLNDWMFRAITKDRRVLTINPDYFELKMGLERRLYELARKHCGHQKNWSISLSKLANKCGTVRDLRKFRADLRKVISREQIPDYQLFIKRESQHRKSPEIVTFKSLFPRTKASQNNPFSIEETTWSQAQQRYPKYDIQTIQIAWKTWIQGQNQVIPQNKEQAFLAFCEKFVANNPI